MRDLNSQFVSKMKITRDQFKAAILQLLIDAAPLEGNNRLKHLEETISQRFPKSLIIEIVPVLQQIIQNGNIVVSPQLQCYPLGDVGSLKLWQQNVISTYTLPSD